MAHPLAALIQPLIDEWLASDDGVLAQYELEMSETRIAC